MQRQCTNDPLAPSPETVGRLHVRLIDQALGSLARSPVQSRKASKAVYQLTEPLQSHTVVLVMMMVMMVMMVLMVSNHV